MSDKGEVKTRVLESGDWINSWDEGRIGFHKDYIHPFLQKYLSTLLEGQSYLKILFPLCGKSWDIKWLADQGHTVVGVEVAQKAIEDFFAEQKVAFTSQPAPEVEGTLFQSEDQKIKVYCCDFFKFSKDAAGQMDAVFDRAAMVAINRQDRERYVQVMKSLMAPHCKYLLASLHYDETKYSGPPHNLDDAVIHQLFGDVCTVKELESMDVLEERQRKWGIDSLVEKAFLITLK